MKENLYVVYGDLRSPFWREAPCGPWQQDGCQWLPSVSIYSAYRRARKSTDTLVGHASHAGVVGVVDVGVGA